MQRRSLFTQQLLAVRHRMLVASCAVAVVASSGCRSAMPKWNMFSFGKKPTPEMLAGNGPTTTYPAPPSESATPQAIASSAGGTTASANAIAAAPQTPAGSGIGSVPGTGFDIASATSGQLSDLGGPAAGPGAPSAQGLPSTQGLGAPTNLAAAQANGYNFPNRNPAAGGAATAGVPDYAKAAANPNASVPAVPAGYQFGARDEQPGGPAMGLPAGGPLSGIASSNPAPEVGGLELPSGPAAGNASPGGGFSLPDGLNNVAAAASAPTNSKPFTPKLPSAGESVASSGVSMRLPGTAESAIPGATSPTNTPGLPPIPAASGPDYTTASASLAPPASSPAPSPGDGYAPGSTSRTSGYPGANPATTGGSFYR